MMRLLAYRPNRYHLWLGVLLSFIVAGLVAAAIIFTRGLVVTNLTDLVPWGLWITIDLSAIGLSAGAFLLSAGVYLLGLKQFRPLARTAVYVGLIGYTMAVMTLLLDIGRPERFWHALVFWNTHSVLWEVTMCVTLYLLVLTVEVAPIVGEAEWFRRSWPRPAEILAGAHKAAPALAVIGLVLSLLHQSSLGATYAVVKARPIWFHPGLSILFIVSAMAAGPAMTLLVTLIAARLSQKASVKPSHVDSLSRFIGWTLVAYLYLRFWDVLATTYTYDPGRTESLNLLLRGPLAFNFWVAEMLLGIIVPMVVLLHPSLRRNRPLHLFALALIVAGLVAYRWDTNLVGQLAVLSYLPNETVVRYTTYIPSLIEWIAGAGVIAFGILAVTLGIRHLNVVDHGAEVRQLLTAAAD